VPLNVTFELTLRCNLRCLHCYNFDRDLPYLPGKDLEDELSDAEIHRILDEVREEGCLYLAFTGGEALVHPGLDDFVRHAGRSGMMVRIKSNGTLVTAAAAARLARAGVAAIDISLYGAEAATHDDLVKRSGAFERTIQGARAARDAGMLVKLNFVATRRNVEQIARMVELAVEMGVAYGIDPQIQSRHDGSHSSLDMRLERKALERLYRGPLRKFIAQDVEDKKSVQCSCARSVCGISAFGEVYPCIGAPVPSGNLRERSFHDIWLNSPQLNSIRALRLEDFPACSGCDLRRFCRRSSGVVFTNTGNYTGPGTFGEDWACMEAEVIRDICREAAT
jgi:radical SAM protein with 4Fe4S-binding SPASM domain